jgi:ribosomal 50S subunit-recycling heat shock protein
MNVKLLTTLSATAAVALATLGAAPISAQDKPAATVTTSVTHTATVTKIDAKDRWVTMKMEDGGMLDVEAGPEVKNFAQIKVGDHVSFTQADTVAIEVVPAGQAAPNVSGGSAVVSAPQGAKPMGIKVDTVQVSGAVTAIDYGKRHVTVKGPAGNLRTFEVGKAAKNFKNVKVGDVVVVTLTTATTIEVTAPTK